jgi:hypothetical protein
VSGKDRQGEKEMTTMTEKQAQYRESLIGQQIRRYSPANNVARMQAIARAALALALPVPQDSYEASVQIDALKSDIMIYAGKHQVWAQPVMVRLANLIGAKGERVPAKLPAQYAKPGMGEGWEWTEAGWEAYVRDLLTESSNA